MPSRCCIPYCKGNYDNGPRVRAFSFPFKNEEMRQKWIRAIPRKFEDNFNFRYAKVCEKHFNEEDFQKTSSYTNPSTGEVIEVPLQNYRLFNSVVPSIFPRPPPPPSSPTTIDKTTSTKKKSTKKQQQGIRRGRKQFRHDDLAAAAADDQASHDYETLLNLKGLAQLIRCRVQHPHGFWSVLERQQQEAILILHLVDEPGPTVKYAVVIDDDFNLAAFVRGQPVKSVGNIQVVEVLSNFGNLERLLEAFVSLDSLCETESATSVLCDVLQSGLKDLRPLCAEDSDEGTVGFLSDQIGQLKTSKSGGSSRSWSVDVMVTWCLLYSVSPQAYGFLRGSRKLILPHPSRVQRLCLWYDVAFSFEQQENLLASVGHRVQQLSGSDKIVVLSINHIDLKPHLGHRGSTGSHAFVFSIRSLLCDFEELALVLLARTTMIATCFHDVIKKVILKLELGFGCKVIAVVTDSSGLLDQKAMSMFSEPSKLLEICYPHPADKTRPLFFLFDAAHVLRRIRDTWLERKNEEVCLRFPEFHLVVSNDVGENNVTNTDDADSDYSALHTASFATLRKLHAMQAMEKEVVPSGPKKSSGLLTSRALNPTPLERQNDTRLALQVFSESTSRSLNTVGVSEHLPHAATTAEFVDIVRNWWSIVDVHHCPAENRILECAYGRPIDKMGDIQIKFLEDFVTWLDRWLTLDKEMHSVLRQTTYALAEISSYCLEELGFPHVLLGKLSMTSREGHRGGHFLYPLSDPSHCNVSVRQMYASPEAVRYWCSMPVLQGSHLDFGSALDTLALAWPLGTLQLASTLQFEVSIDDDVIRSPYPNVAVVTYVASCCTHVFLNHFRCDFCRDNLLTDRNLEVPDEGMATCRVRKALTSRGAGLKLPTQAVTNAVFYADVVVQQLQSKANSARFYCAPRQKDIALEWAMFFLRDVDDLEARCGNGHARETVLRKLLHSAVGILLNCDTTAAAAAASMTTTGHVSIKGHKKCKLSHVV